MHVYMQVEGEHIAKNVHTTTAQLPCRLQNFLAIISFEFGWAKRTFPTHLNWVAKIDSETGPRIQFDYIVTQFKPQDYSMGAIWQTSLGSESKTHEMKAETKKSNAQQ